MLQGFVQQSIAVVTKPSIATFDGILAANPTTWTNISIILAILGAIAGAVGGFIAGLVTGAELHHTLIGGISGLISGLILGIIAAFASFFVGTGILYLLAHAFNGTGSFLTYGYALLLVGAPLALARALFSWVPALGGLVVLAAGVYGIYLEILATASVHRLPMNRAVWVVLIPVLAAIVLTLVVAVLFAALYLAVRGIH